MNGREREKEMGDVLLDLLIDVDEAGAACVTLGDTQYRSVPDLLAAVSDLRTADNVDLCADALNHLARGFDYEVIHDADGFRDAYRQQRAAEEGMPDAGPGEVRLSNYPEPPMSEIREPWREGHTIVFFARASYLGVPYRAEISDAGEVMYTPLMA